MEFHEIDVAKMNKYREHVKLCLQVPSDMSPYILLAYKDIHQIKSAFAHDLFWFKAQIGEEECWMPPIGNWDGINWKEIFKVVPAGAKFKYVPELLLCDWEESMPGCFTIENDRDNWDYIWHLKEIANAKGKKHRGYRWAYNKFKSSYNYRIDKLTPDLFDTIKQFHEQCEVEIVKRTDKISDANEESKAFYKLLDNWDEQYLYGYILWVENEIACVWIDEILDKKHIIGLYTKQNYAFKGITGFSYITEAAIAIEKGFSIMNVMSDIGSKGLRRHKESSHPLTMLKKYVICYKGDG